MLRHIDLIQQFKWILYCLENRVSGFWYFCNNIDAFLLFFFLDFIKVDIESLFERSLLNATLRHILMLLLFLLDEWGIVWLSNVVLVVILAVVERTWNAQIVRLSSIPGKQRYRLIACISWKETYLTLRLSLILKCSSHLGDFATSICMHILFNALDIVFRISNNRADTLRMNRG